MTDVRGELLRIGALVAALAVTVTGCRKDVMGLDSDNSALVYGTVSNSRGQPVDSATVRTTAYSNLCGSRVFASSRTVTDDRGRYADTLLFFRTRIRGCLTVEAIPPEGADLTSEIVELSTRSIWSTGLDSVQLDFTLRPRSRDGGTQR